MKQEEKGKVKRGKGIKKNPSHDDLPVPFPMEVGEGVLHEFVHGVDNNAAAAAGGGGADVRINEYEKFKRERSINWNRVRVMTVNTATG